MLRGFLSDRRGGVAATFAVALVPMLIAIGGAIEYTRASLDQSQLRSALDAAVLAGMNLSARDKKYGREPKATAGKVFRANYPGDTRTLNFTFEEDGSFKGVVSVRHPLFWGAILGQSEWDYSTTSTAVAANPRMPVCFMAMHPSRKHTLELDDTVSVYAPDCNIYGNSDDEDDVVDPHTSKNYLTGKTVQAVGYGHHYLQNVTPPLAYAPEILSDPMSSFAYPSAGTCLATAKNVTVSNTVLSPGTYCQGLNIFNANNVTFQPGTYIITGKTFKIKNSTISGSGVTIVILDASTPITWDNSRVVLTAPASGDLKGIAIMASRQASDSTITSTFVDVHGLIYLPKTAFVWTNSSSERNTAKWTSWIVDGISWKGSGTIYINFDWQNADIPFPNALKAVLPYVGEGRLRITH